MNNTMKLVERLTAIFPPHGTLAFEAADAIETLQARVKCLEEALAWAAPVLEEYINEYGPTPLSDEREGLARIRATLANQGGEKTPSPKEE